MAADEPDPPRKFYEFKPREFERVNPVVPAAAPLVASPIKGTRPVSTSKPITVQDILREANAGRDAPVIGVATNATKNDVHGHLATNLEKANAAGLNKLKPLEVRPSRRKRDYFILLAVGNPIFAAIVLLGHDVPIVFVCGIAGAAMYNVSITWVMWFIMDRH
jgi:hypothetical protein